MTGSGLTGTAADLASLRALAEEGRNRPLLGGRHFIVWGCAIAGASLMHMAIATGVLGWPLFSLAIVWAVFTGGAAAITSFVLKVDKPQNTIGSRVEHEVWKAGGAVLGTTALAILVFAYLQLARSGSPDAFRLFALMPPITFGVYAIALAASAAAAGAAYLKPFAALSVVFLVLTALLANSAW